MLDPGEACDDGNLDPTDLCLPDCTASPLLVWFDFEGDAQNLGGEPRYDGVVADTASYVAGKVGMALACAGQGPNVTIPGLRDLLVAHPSVTVGVWVREDPALAYTSLLDLRMASPSGTGFETYHGIDPNAGFVTCVSGAGGFIGCETFPASTGTWHHVTWRYAGTGTGPGEGAPVEIFLDGQLAATVANPAMDPVLTDELDADGYLCGLWGAGGTEVNFEIDAFKIWGAVFAPSQQCEVVVGGTWENGVCVPP
ncbi:MAG: hypothetical protein D6705_06160 [Deltaproteobacteria bacterium]|nr:MAG: hypothetical protein D6705_06160 [Deltaproteobacteria bacterium]